MDNEEISLEEIRQKLAILEDSIIFSLIGRSKFKTNKRMYTLKELEVPEFDESFVEIDKSLLPKGININRNKEIKKIYLEKIPFFCEKGNDNKYSAAALWDIKCLQDLSRRIHLGILIAELKYKQDPKGYINLIKNKNTKEIIKKLRDARIEKQVLDRLKEKSKKYGFNSKFIYNLYKNHIIPLTIDVEVEYLFKRTKKT